MNIELFLEVLVSNDIDLHSNEHMNSFCQLNKSSFHLSALGWAKSVLSPSADKIRPHLPYNNALVLRWTTFSSANLGEPHDQATLEDVLLQIGETH